MKTIWFYFQILLFILLSGSIMAGADNLTGILITIFLLQSFPLNLLAAWLFYAFGDITGSSAGLFLMAVTFCLFSYLQWFKLVPRITDFFRALFQEHDKEVQILISENEIKRLPNSPKVGDDWAEMVVDREKYSPVERVFNNDST